MGLVTPEKIRTLPNKLYAKAKQDRRHKVASRATRQFPSSKIFGELGVQRLRSLHLGNRVGRA